MMNNRKKKREEYNHDLCFHNTVISGLVPHALIKMVCTHNFTFQASLNERSLPNAYELCFPVAGLQAPAKVPS
jgi:hypothetical protein